jgi:hypothetical protein
MPTDCQQLVDNWSTGGVWLNEAAANVAAPPMDCYIRPWQTAAVCDFAESYTERNSGGLFGTGALLNGADGTYFTYDAKAIQGVDDKDRGNHHTPGTSRPSLNSGNSWTSYVFFGEPLVKVAELNYGSGVDAISSVFMHELLMNEYSVNANVGARSEWVVTFPTKNWYVDPFTRPVSAPFYVPAGGKTCNFWEQGDPIPNFGLGKWVGGSQANGLAPDWPGGINCEEFLVDGGHAPFTSIFNGEACEWYEVVDVWDREESPSLTQGSGPIVSPPPPGNAPPGSSEICYETNVIRWSNDETPDDGTEIFGSPAAKSITLAPGLTWEGLPAKSGWAQLNFWNPATAGTSAEHIDWEGLVGLPVTGFWALAVTNSFVGDDNVIANYGGLFGHKANIRRDGKCWSRWGNYCGSGNWYY